MAQSRVRAASRSFNLPNGDDGEADKAAITERTTTDIAKGGARPCYQTGTKHQVMDGRHDTTAAPQIQLFASKIGGTTETSTLNIRSFPICPESPGAMLSRRYDFLLSISPHFVSFAWRYLGATRCVRSLADE